MALSVAQLRTPLTEDEALEQLLSILDGSGFQVTAWTDGSVQLTMLRAFAALYAVLTTYVATLVSWGFNELAEDDGLTHFSRSHYVNERGGLVAARHEVKFTCQAGSGPYTGIAANSLVVSDGVSYFWNTSTVAIADGTTTTIEVECQAPGSLGNAAPNTITRMTSSFAGVTCNNPAIAGSTQSYTRLGTDTESNEALRRRNSSKWATLSAENTSSSIENIATATVEAITKVAVDDSNPRGAGTVDIYIAGDESTAGTSDVTAVQTAVRARFFNSDPRIIVYAATEYELPISGTVTFDASYTSTEVQSFVEAALLELIIATQISKSFGLPNGRLQLSDIYEAIEGATGVISSVISIGTTVGYITIPDWQLAVKPTTWPLSYVAQVLV